MDKHENDYRKIAKQIEKVASDLANTFGDVPITPKGDSILAAMHDALRSLNAAKDRCDLPITHFDGNMKLGTEKKLIEKE